MPFIFYNLVSNMTEVYVNIHKQQQQYTTENLVKMSKILKTLTKKHCAHIQQSKTELPSIRSLIRRMGPPMTIPTMYHCVGFDGEKYKKFDVLNNAVFRQQAFLIFRPFYQHVNASIFINGQNGWEHFADIKRKTIEFSALWKMAGFAVEPRTSEWLELLKTSGISKYEPPITGGLPTIFEVLNAFSIINDIQSPSLAHVTRNLLDGMTRSKSTDIYLSAMRSILTLLIQPSEKSVSITSTVPDATISIDISTDETEKLQHRDNGVTSFPAIPKMINELRNDALTDGTAGRIQDILLMRAIHNSLVAVPMPMYNVHSIQYELNEADIVLNVKLRPVLDVDPVVIIRAQIEKPTEV